MRATQPPEREERAAADDMHGDRCRNRERAGFGKARPYSIRRLSAQLVASLVELPVAQREGEQCAGQVQRAEVAEVRSSPSSMMASRTVKRTIFDSHPQVRNHPPAALICVKVAWLRSAMIVPLAR